MFRRFQFNLKWLFLAMLVVCGAFGWLVWRIECPICHGGNVDEAGRCRLGDNCPYFSDAFKWQPMELDSRSAYTGSPGHILKEFCPACDGAGTIKRLDWLQSPRPANALRNRLFIETMTMPDGTRWSRGPQIEQ